MNKLSFLFLGLLGCRPAPAPNVPPPAAPAPVSRPAEATKPPPACPPAAQVLRDAYGQAFAYARAAQDPRVIRKQVVEYSAPDEFDASLCRSSVVSRTDSGGHFRVFLTHERRPAGWRLIDVSGRVYPED